MKKTIFLLSFFLCIGMGCDQENTSSESEKIAVIETPTPIPTPTPTLNPDLKPEERALVVQMYKEALKVDKLYQKAFEQKDEQMFNEARGLGYALVRRDEKDDNIMNHPGIQCYRYFQNINGSRTSQWFDYKNNRTVDDYTSERVEKAKNSLSDCKSSAKQTGLLNESEMTKELPYVKPVRF